MGSRKTKSVLHALLGLALLLTGATNLFTVSVDNDGDDATPPISVELSVDAPTHKTVQVAKADTQHHHSNHATATQPETSGFSGSEYQPAFGPEMSSPQLLVPLRT